MTESVTISKAHFEALLRRAEFCSSEPDFFEAFKTDNVSISRTEYEALCQSYKEYAKLRSALLSGGIESETLNILIHGDSQQAVKGPDFAPVYWTETTKRTTTPTLGSRISGNSTKVLYGGGSSARHSSAPTSWRRPNDGLQVPKDELTWQQQDSFGRPYSPMSFDDPGDDFASYGTNYIQEDTVFPRHGQRTLLITGLSDRITYKDLTDAIRGGRILHIVIRRDHSAIVFMLEGAAEFLAHVKRHDLYIQAKRLEVTWNDHQYKLTPYIGRKMAAGASRNLLLRNATRIVNIAEIRNHMEHIHQLDIIHVETRGTNILIYTNSVHNALFARTCMLSRKPYKGLKIDFYPDECGSPLRSIQPHFGSSDSNPLVAGKKQARRNFFEMLSLDSDEEDRPPGRIDDDDDTINGDSSGYGISLGSEN